jgi:hypothetical protein
LRNERVQNNDKSNGVRAAIRLRTGRNARHSNHFKQQLKAKGNSFQKEVEKFLNTAYGGGNTDLTIIELLEHCQNKIDEIIENEVTFVE